MRALVIGGGIGGMAAAIALERAGIDAEVFERAPDLASVEVGAGVHLWSNAFRALRVLGVDEEVAAVGSETERFQYWTFRGRRLADWPVKEASRKLGAPTYGVARPDLHRTLAAAVGAPIRVASECVGFTQDANGVHARFADGSESGGDVLVGADGLRSTIRAHLRGAEPPRYAGVTSWRGIVAAEDERAPKGLFRFWWGPGRIFIVYRVGGGRPYWLAIANSAPDERDPEEGAKAAVLERFEGWPDPIGALVEATDEAKVVRTDLYDRPPVKRWTNGRVALLGDAAHPMTPHLGQGAGSAIEDAVVIAKSLAADRDVPTALLAYQDARRKRTAKFTNLAKSINVASGWENPLAWRARHAVARAIFPNLAWRAAVRDYDIEF